MMHKEEVNYLREAETKLMNDNIRLRRHLRDILTIAALDQPIERRVEDMQRLARLALDYSGRT